MFVPLAAISLEERSEDEAYAAGRTAVFQRPKGSDGAGVERVPQTKAAARDGEVGVGAFLTTIPTAPGAAVTQRN